MNRRDTPSQHLPAVPFKLRRGVDELNFAEFPICLFSSNPVHVAASGKTIEFQDEIPNPATPGTPITRTVTVTGTDKYGLPTALDDWVILGLFQMAKLQDFPERLNFTRYHLLKLLGWGTNSRDYRKLTECLRRIQGVQFTFEKAWWDGKAGSWVSRTFNLYQDLEIYEDENSTTRPKPNVRQATFSFACSSFVWSEFLHSNFLNRAVKGLNFHFVKSLSKPTAKRLFRYLDKHFYNRNRLDFDLHEFAVAHMGLRPGQKVGDIKRTLLGAISELEDCSYIKPLPPGERFPKVKRGRYRIVLEKGKFEPAQHEEKLDSAVSHHARRVAQALQNRGVSDGESLRVASAFSETLIRHHIDVFDWEANQGKEFPNPGGYLRTRITENYTDPPGFIPRAERERLDQEKKEQVERKRQKREQQKAADETAEEERTQRIAAFWNSLSPDARKAAEAEAISSADRSQREWMKRGGLIKESTFKNLTDAYAEKRLV